MVLYLGDAKEKLKRIRPNSIDAVVTDPPYGLSFMNKKWDYDVPTTELWREVYRVLKPGGHLLAFFGTRTYHRGVVRIEDAGFEIRDQIQWIYGQGFPKSQNIALALDKQAGAIGHRGKGFNVAGQGIGLNENKHLRSDHPDFIAPNGVTDLAKQWQGWGTALKPANEPICLARKPIEKGLTIAENVAKWGTGAINVDGCRVGDFENKTPSGLQRFREWSDSHTGQSRPIKPSTINQAQGRWPANVVLDEAAAELLDAQSGNLGVSRGGNSRNVGNKIYGEYKDSADGKTCGFGDSGGASRFFYCAKASKSERNAGLEGMPLREIYPQNNSIERRELNSTSNKRVQNHHPTVKPIKLMQYLCKLITPPNGVVLDPFMGSGSTGVAAKHLGFRFIGIELKKEYFEIAKRRIKHAQSRASHSNT